MPIRKLFHGFETEGGSGSGVKRRYAEE